MGTYKSRISFEHDASARLTVEAPNWFMRAPDHPREAAAMPPRAGDLSNDMSNQQALARLVKAAEDELRRRKIRASFLPKELFGEGAWTMLLDLFVSQHRGRKVSTTSACIAADVPDTTALRWLEVLEMRGLIERTYSAADKRVKYVSLTEKAHAALVALLGRQLA